MLTKDKKLARKDTGLNRQLQRARNVVRHLVNGDLQQYLEAGYSDYNNKRRREKWRKLFEGNKKTYVIKNLGHGVKMRCYQDSWLSKLIYWGVFERDEQEFVSSYLGKGDIVIDVGAHYGLYTLLAAKAVGSSGHVYAFEPTAKTHERLLDHIKDNDTQNVTAYRMAISDCEGQTSINTMHDGKEACNTLTAPGQGDSFTAEKVNTTTLDSFVNNNHLHGKVKLIKIDVEGWESQLLDGGKELLASEDAPVLLIEFNEQMAKAAGSTCKVLYEKLEKFGYQMFIYESSGKKFIREHEWKNYDYKNLIISKRPEEFIERIRGAKIIS